MRAPAAGGSSGRGATAAGWAKVFTALRSGPVRVAHASTRVGVGSRHSSTSSRSPPSPHLAGFDPARAPRFVWPARLAQARGVAAGDADDAVAADTPSLQMLKPDARPAWHSVGGGQATKVVFENGTAAVVTVDWMDFQGHPRTYFTLQPGARVESATYAGHVWRARDAGGRVLTYIVAGEQPGTAVIREAGVP